MRSCELGAEVAAVSDFLFRVHCLGFALRVLEHPYSFAATTIVELLRIYVNDTEDIWKLGLELHMPLES
jgi:hypothetical protein